MSKLNSRHIREGYLTLPDEWSPVSPARIKELLQEEWAYFVSHSKISGIHNERASLSLPLGVTSSFQHWEPYPITMCEGRGAYLKDLDGRWMLDLSMGFGAMLVGHRNPKITRALQKTLKNTGMLFVTPSDISTEAAERFKKRFGLDMVRFTNSGTESTMYAIRIARVVTGKDAIVKVEGGYHGGYDPLQVSVKPDLDLVGDAANPMPYTPKGVQGGEVFIVPYNNLKSLEALLKKESGKIACFIVEPVIENLSIVLPDEGYLEGVRELCDKYNVALIFDEVKTGLTSGVSGAAGRLKVKPDLVTLAKSIGGGMPIAAFGGDKKYMSAVVDGRMPHFGTYNGNPISASAIIAVDKIATARALAKAEKINKNTLDKISGLIKAYKLPAHTVGFGVKGAVIWSPTVVRNYRDFKQTNFELAELSWLWYLNRGIITPPGLDEQWLVSLMTKQNDMNKLIIAFEDLAKALRAD